MALYNKVVNLISRPPDRRTTIECQELVDWLKGRSRLFANVKYGKQRFCCMQFLSVFANVMYVFLFSSFFGSFSVFANVMYVFLFFKCSFSLSLLTTCMVRNVFCCMQFLSVFANVMYGKERFCVVCSFCLLYTSPSPRDMLRSRMPSSA